MDFCLRTCLCIECLFGKFVMQGHCMMTSFKFKKDVRVLISSVLKVDYFRFGRASEGEKRRPEMRLLFAG